MITELGKLYRPVTTRPQEDGRYLTIIGTSSGDEATVQNFRDGRWGLPNQIRAWMPIPPIPDKFDQVCFLDVGNELELEEGETGSLVIHPPEGVDGASIEVIVTVVEDLKDDEGNDIPPGVAVILKSYLGESDISLEQISATFKDAKKIIHAEKAAKERYGAAHPELVIKELEEHRVLEEAQQKLIQEMFEETDDNFEETDAN